MGYQERTVSRQEVHWVPEDRTLALSEKPFRVWTLYLEGYGKTPTLPIVPQHHVNAFLEDYVHDWNWHSGKFVYFSRVARDRVWILVEYADEVKPKKGRRK